MKIERKHRMIAFTLVELLVVISIIALLIAILLPSLQAARNQAKKVVCQTNVRSLSQAAFTYSTEFNRYPPSLSNYANSPGSGVRALRWQGGRDWLGIADQGGRYAPGQRDDPQTGEPKGFTAAPRFGVLWPWVKDEKAYLCAADKEGRAQNTVLGGGGNGKFSYTMFSAMGLRKPEAIPPRPADVRTGGRGGGPSQAVLMPKPAFARSPIFVEEHPTGINDKFSPTGHMEGNFNFSTDFVVSRHPGFTKRDGKHPTINPASVTSFKQGTTNIGFADGHVEAIQVNYGFGISEVRPSFAGGQGLKGIPYNAEGLLYYYGIEFQEFRNNMTTLEVIE